MACRFLLVLIALPLLAEAQSDDSYVISTFAGTPVPHTPTPSKSVSIFQRGVLRRIGPATYTFPAKGCAAYSNFPAAP
jgi:hypothetical protein